MNTASEQNAASESAKPYNYFEHNGCKPNIPVVADRDSFPTSCFEAIARAVLVLATLDLGFTARAYSNEDPRGELFTTDYLMAIQKDVGSRIFDFMDNSQYRRDGSNDLKHSAWADLHSPAEYGRPHGSGGIYIPSKIWQGTVEFENDASRITAPLVRRLQRYALYFLRDDNVNKKLQDTFLAINMLDKASDELLNALEGGYGKKNLKMFLSNTVVDGQIQQKIIYAQADA